MLSKVCRKRFTQLSYPPMKPLSDSKGFVPNKKSVETLMVPRVLEIMFSPARGENLYLEMIFLHFEEMCI